MIVDESWEGMKDLPGSLSIHFQTKLFKFAAVHHPLFSSVSVDNMKDSEVNLNLYENSLLIDVI